MGQLIFIAIIVIFSILDSVARTRRKRRARGPVAVPEVPPEWETHEGSYDAEPSYDEIELERERAEAEAQARAQQPQPLPQYTQPYGRGGATRPEPKSSEGMIPADLWQEIAGLARGRIPKPPAPKPAPRRTPPKTVPRRPVETHRVHRSHVGFGTDPSSRPRSEQDGLDPLAAHLGVDAASARHQLLSGSRHALRQAMILQEVLGPPAALRSDPFDG